MAPRVIRLSPADAERYVRVRRRMLTAAPWAFSATPEDDEALDPQHVAELLSQVNHATFAIEAVTSITSEGAVVEEATRRPDLVGVASLTRGKPPKFAHRARIWGFFVEPGYRGRGLGSAIMNVMIAEGRTWLGVDFLDLAVSANSPEAQRLYTSLGFVVWGREPKATAHEGSFYDEIHMTLRL